MLLFVTFNARRARWGFRGLTIQTIIFPQTFSPQDNIVKEQKANEQLSLVPQMTQNRLFGFRTWLFLNRPSNMPG